MLLQVVNSNVIIFKLSIVKLFKMKTVLLTSLIEKQGRQVVADQIGCHLTLVNQIIAKKRKVYAVVDESESVIDHCYEVRDFPNKKISNAKKQKTSVVGSN